MILLFIYLFIYQLILCLKSEVFFPKPEVGPGEAWERFLVGLKSRPHYQAGSVVSGQGSEQVVE